MIAILITTFERDNLLYKSVQSIVDNCPNNCIILVGDQGNISEEKEKWYLDMKTKYPEIFHFRQFPFDCGLSYVRNRLVELAKQKNCEYCILGSDSFLFNDSIKNIVHLEENGILYNYDLIGFELSGCVCGWEAIINLIKDESFELDFIEKPIDKIIHSCEIVRNFFIAKTNSLYNTKWDENLKLCEHEDFFWRYKLNNYNVCWTNLINGEKMKDRPDAYKDKRRINFNEGMEKLRKKYNISGWVTYKNLDRSKLDK